MRAWPRMAEVLESAEGRSDWTRAVEVMICAPRDARRRKGVVKERRSFIVSWLTGNQLASFPRVVLALFHTRAPPPHRAAITTLLLQATSIAPDKECAPDSFETVPLGLIRPTLGGEDATRAGGAREW